MVNIIAVKVMRTPDQGASPFGMEDPLRDFFEKFFGGQIPKEYQQNALGTGVIIVEIENGSAAADAGLAAGDIIVEIDKQPVNDIKTLNKLLAGVKKGYTILFLIDRGGTTIFVTLNVKK